MILISGATGNVGKELVRYLLDEGEQIRILVRDKRKIAGDPPPFSANFSGKWGRAGEGVEIVVADLDKPETLTAAMRGVDRLYFVTPVTAQVGNLLKAAKEAGVRHVVKQSTIEADRSLGPGRWHREQEESIKALGFAWTFIRPTMFMSNTIEWWGATIKSQNAVYFPGGRGRVPPVDPQDVAAVARTVLTQAGHEGKFYEVTGPEALTIGEMVDVLAKALGKPLRYVNVPAFLAALWLRKFGMSRELVRALMETLGALRRNEYAYVTDVVARIGGVNPHPFEAWCQEHADAFRA